MEQTGLFGYDCSVFTLTSTFVEIEVQEPRDLLDRAQAGDTDAFCEICRIYENRLLRQALALCGEAVLAEDLAQDTLVEAWRCLRRYNGRCRFFTWLCAILVNRFRNALRARRRSRTVSRDEADQRGFPNSLQQIADHALSPDHAAQHREQSALVRECIRALPARHQQVICLRFYVDDSLEGIAAALGCSPGTVKSRLYHALEKLRTMKALAEQSVDHRLKAEVL